MHHYKENHMKYTFSNKILNLITAVIFGLIILFMVSMLLPAMGQPLTYTNIYMTANSAFFYVMFFLAWSCYLTSKYMLAGCDELCTKVYRYKSYNYVLVLEIVNTLATVIIFTIACIMSSLSPNFDYVYMVCLLKRVVLSFFLAATASILLGLIIGSIRNKKAIIVVFLVTAIILSPVFATMYNSADGKLIHILENLNLIQCNTYAMEYRFFLDSTPLYKWIKILGIIAILLIPLIIKTTEKTKGRILICSCFCLIFIGCEAYYYAPHSYFYESYYDNSFIEFYNNQSGDMEDIVDFTISEYDLDIDFDEDMKCRCNLTLEGELKKAYTFTLYHTLKVTSVKSGDSDVKYSQAGDYLTIYDPKSSAITIDYKGIIDMYPATKSLVYLPEFFPYYPIAGKKTVVSDDPAAAHVMNDFASNYKLSTNLKDLYTTNTNHKTKGIMILSANYEKKIVGDYTYIIPRYTSPAVTDQDLKDNNALLDELLPSDYNKGSRIILIDKQYALTDHSYHIGDDILYMAGLPKQKITKELLTTAIKERFEHAED